MSPNGARNEHLTPFGFTHAAGSREAAALADFAFFDECYVNVLLPAWYYCLCLRKACRLAQGEDQGR
jgi:hypothetical protein